MAGYSATPLVKKLGIKAGQRVLLAQAPHDFTETLGELPKQVRLAERLGTTFDLGVAFFMRERDLRKHAPQVASFMHWGGSLWLAWPKKSANTGSDLDEHLVREIGLATGLVDNKVCAIDESWSGLRFVMRLKDRPKASPRARGRQGQQL
jgi:hypothetical protein